MEKVSSCAWLWVSLWVRNWKWNNLIFYCWRRNMKNSWSIISNKRTYSEIIIWILRPSAKEHSPFFDPLDSLKRKNNYLFELLSLYWFFLCVSFQWFLAEQPACVRTLMYPPWKDKGLILEQRNALENSTMLTSVLQIHLEFWHWFRSLLAHVKECCRKSISGSEEMMPLLTMWEPLLLYWNEGWCLTSERKICHHSGSGSVLFFFPLFLFVDNARR